MEHITHYVGLPTNIKFGDKAIRTLFTKFLTPGLIREFCNPMDNWLNWLIPTNHQADYKIRVLTQELKSW